MKRVVLSTLAALVISGSIGFGIWWQDRPVSSENIQAFVSEAPCHQVRVSYKLAITKRSAPLVQRDLWVIASDCRDEAKGAEAALTKAKQWKAVQGPN